MDAEVFRFGQFIAQGSLLVPALVLLVWGFQQRQVYEKRPEGRLKLTIGAALLAAFGLTVAVSVFTGPETDAAHDPSASDIGDSQVESLVYDATKYLRSIDQVRVKVTEDDSLNIDATFVEDQDAVGSVFYGDAKVRFIRIGDDMFLSASDEFWKAKATPEAIDIIDGRWIRADVDDKRWAQLTGTPDRTELLDPLTSTRTFTLGEPATIRGVTCQVLKSGRDGSRLYISDSPRRMLRFEGGGGFVLDYDYDAPDVTLKAPSRIVEASDVLASGSAS